MYIRPEGPITKSVASLNGGTVKKPTFTKQSPHVASDAGPVIAGRIDRDGAAVRVVVGAAVGGTIETDEFSAVLFDVGY